MVAAATPVCGFGMAVKARFGASAGLSPEGEQLYRLPGHWQKGVV
jgi:hypothetical protein